MSVDSVLCPANGRFACTAGSSGLMEVFKLSLCRCNVWEESVKPSQDEGLSNTTAKETPSSQQRLLSHVFVITSSDRTLGTPVRSANIAVTSPPRPPSTGNKRGIHPTLPPQKLAESTKKTIQIFTKTLTALLFCGSKGIYRSGRTRDRNHRRHSEPRHAPSACSVFSGGCFPED